MIERRLVAAGAGLAGLAVVLGAFGAHALKAHLSTEALGWWRTATDYQMWHALALLILGFQGLRWTRLPARFLLCGTLIFSGSLYGMALGGPRWLGAITPIGGLMMISGWALLAWRGAREVAS